MNIARRTQHRDRREDVSRTRYEDQTQRQTDDESAARTAGLASDHSRERPFQPLTDHGNHETQADEAQEHDSHPHQRVLGKMQSRENLRADEHEKTETQDESEDNRDRTTPRTLRGFAGVGRGHTSDEHDGQYGQDAR